MALIPCPDCGRDVSDIAPTCPQCGRPMIVAKPRSVPAEPLVTTQLTGKGLKAHILLAWFTLLLGLFGLFAADQPDKTVFSWMVIGGIAWLILAKLTRWWKHA